MCILLVLFNECFLFLYLSIFLMCNVITCTLQMEGIPGKARNLQMNLLMGKLYRISRHIRPAISCYKECLRFDKSIGFTPTFLHLILQSIFLFYFILFLLVYFNISYTF